jgi:hypothetical protein
MQYTEVENQLDDWIKFRQNLVNSISPLEDIADYWSKKTPIQYNHSIDPYYPGSWPSPWEIIAEGKYDDLTIAIMIGYTIKLTEQFKNSSVVIKIQVDLTRTRLYNLVYVDDMYVLNYDQFNVVKAQDIEDSFFLENLVELAKPR